ncbi:MAG: cache domain-containing protein [Pseudomonadota bacterium]
MFRRQFPILLSAFALLITGPALASVNGTRDEAVAMVEDVLDMFAAEGADATFAAISDLENPRFRDRDLYPFVYKFDGHNVAHGAKPQLVGKNLISLKDQGGKLLIEEMVKVAQAGSTGWVDYKWPNPTTDKIEDKTSYIAPLGDGYFVGVGVYKD